MSRLVTWSAPIAAFVACLGIERIISTADLWFGFTLLVAAIAILILPALSPAPADDASTANAPSGGSQPTAGAIEAAPAATAERSL